MPLESLVFNYCLDELSTRRAGLKISRECESPRAITRNSHSTVTRSTVLTKSRRGATLIFDVDLISVK
jgi:hypothetical protein